MKRNVLAITLILFAVFGRDRAFAQSMYIGVQGGAAVATMDVRGIFFQADAEATVGFSGGAVFAIDFSRHIRLQAEALYTMKGAKDEAGTAEFDLRYLEIPLLMVLKLPAKISPHALVGPVLSFELSCKIRDNAGSNLLNCEELLTGPQVKSADAGLMFGAGVDLGLGRSTLYFDAVYNLGLTNLSEPTGPGIATDIKNRTFYLNVGLLYPLFDIDA